ncbi:flagellar motor protein MotB [Thiolapillus brandeum]|uniref:Chemotaxis protein MotB n=1 Tax=Thiolapillus brandeum TaxID=1076588 RepID=A0A7U6GIK2_9GAMM|nr:flagellar motor protein MotB [Thiolapillus brandeum]BAO44279.1 chemotaxis protein MotB [Thiolapillus brandeum]
MSDNCEPVKCPEGIPMWVMTFADLMSLLLAFFVLLFSFSEMDAQKYKQVAGSMSEAFGVQRQVKVKDPPKGVNIIAREFSPGRAQETPLNQVRQSTADDYMQFPVLGKNNENKKSDLEKEGERIKVALKEEIEKGLIEVSIEDQKIVIRIQEKGSFPSGSAQMIEPFKDVIMKIKAAIQSSNGRIVVSGHTDNLPIHNSVFRSNWELSASRAVTVLHELSRNSNIGKERFEIKAYADTRPLVPNDTPANRAKNRRVEVAIVYGENKEIPTRPYSSLLNTEPDNIGKNQSAIETLTTDRK